MSMTFKRILQNLVIILLITIGVVSTYNEHEWSDFIFPIWSMMLVVFSSVFGLFLVFRRELSVEGAKQPHILAILACICWAIVAIAALILMIAPWFYGYDLQVLFNSMATMFCWGALGILLTVIELFWSLRTKPVTKDKKE